MEQLNFFKNYEELSSTELFRNKFQNGIDKDCKFCMKTNKEVSFNNKPHVLPELLGNNNYISNDECDSCNLKFGGFETDLSNFISPYLTLISQKTKSKIPEFQGRKKRTELSTTIKIENGNPQINFGDNINDFEYDYTKKVFSAIFKKKKFIPVNVFKSLVKIAMSLCPRDEMVFYRRTIDWLCSSLGDNKFVLDIPYALIRTKFSRKYYPKPFATLYKRKQIIDDDIYYPHLTLVVCSGIMTYQVFIPYCSENENINMKKRKINIEIFPAFMYDIEFPKGQKELNIRVSDLPLIQYDMNYNGIVEEDELIQLSYKDLIRN